MNNLDADPRSIIPKLIFIILLTSINAFFASAEMAIVSVNKSKIKKLSEDGNLKAQLLEKLMKEPSNFLSTIQIGITLTGFFSSAQAATGISGYISNTISSFNIPYAQQLGVIIITIVLSFFTLLFGELVPKRIALKKSEKISLSVARPIYIISIIAKPFVKILSVSTIVVLKATGNHDLDIEEKVSEEEIRTLVSKSLQDGCIENDEKVMISRVFQFNDKMAKEIMISRKDAFIIDVEDDIKDIIDNVLESGYSRVPVYKDHIDNIIGVLYVKDLMVEARKHGFDNINLESILQEPCFVPETKLTNELFKLLKEMRVHLALLFDEYGGFSGIVTMEDLIEEVMGDIDDEYDSEESNISKIDDDNFIVKGILSVSDFNDKFKIDIEDGEYDTLNGYLLTTLGEIPTEGTEVDLNYVKLKILKVGHRRIEEIKVEFNHEFEQNIVNG